MNKKKCWAATIPADHYTPEQLQSLKMHLKKFQQELGELASGNHMRDREQERRYAEMGFKSHGKGGEEIKEKFLTEIGAYYLKKNQQHPTRNK